MFLIKGVNEKRSWLAAIIKNKGEAEEYFSQIEKKEGEDFSLVPIFLREFPFVVLEIKRESNNDIRVLAPVVADKMMRKSYREEGGNIFYPITGQYKANPPGQNNMDDWSKFETDTEEKRAKLKSGLSALGIS